MASTLLVKEIYESIQGESTWAGLPCLFIRLTGCDLRCSYCDSVYAFRGGKRMSVVEVLDEVNQRVGKPVTAANDVPLPLIEVTGGEPLLQAAVFPLMKGLVDRGFQVLVETSGAHGIEQIDPSVRRIVDLKCPSSGESDRMNWNNLEALRSSDEIKFVIATVEDYQWAKEKVVEHCLAARCSVLFSSVAPLTPAQQSAELKSMPTSHTILSRKELVDAVIRDRLPVRFQLQMHKFIWPPDQTGV